MVTKVTTVAITAKVMEGITKEATMLNSKHQHQCTTTRGHLSTTREDTTSSISRLRSNQRAIITTKEDTTKVHRAATTKILRASSQPIRATMDQDSNSIS